MALSFWKEVCRQYPCEWRAPNFIVDPVAGYVNSRIANARTQNCQSQFVAEARLSCIV